MTWPRTGHEQISYLVSSRNHAGLVGAVMLVPLGLLGAAILLVLMGAAICAASVRRLRVVF